MNITNETTVRELIEYLQSDREPDQRTLCIFKSEMDDAMPDGITLVICDDSETNKKLDEIYKTFLD